MDAATNHQAPADSWRIVPTRGGYGVSGGQPFYLNEFKTKREAEQWVNDMREMFLDIEERRQALAAHLESIGSEVRAADVQVGDVIWVRHNSHSWSGHKIEATRVIPFDHGGALIHYDGGEPGNSFYLFTASIQPRLVTRGRDAQ